MPGCAAFDFVRTRLSVGLPEIGRDLGWFLTRHGLRCGGLRFANAISAERANARWFLVAGLRFSAWPASSLASAPRCSGSEGPDGQCRGAGNGLPAAPRKSTASIPTKDARRRRDRKAHPRRRPPAPAPRFTSRRGCPLLHAFTNDGRLLVNTLRSASRHGAASRAYTRLRGVRRTRDPCHLTVSQRIRPQSGRIAA
jgi:hypothetical protein